MKNNSKSILEELKSLKEIYKNREQMFDYYYSGDKDTYIEAFNSIVNDKYNLGNFYDLEVSDSNALGNKYSSEIDKTYDHLVEFGSKMKQFLKEADELISRIEKIELEFLDTDEKREYLINSIIEDE